MTRAVVLTRAHEAARKAERFDPRPDEAFFAAARALKRGGVPARLLGYGDGRNCLAAVISGREPFGPLSTEAHEAFARL